MRGPQARKSYRFSCLAGNEQEEQTKFNLLNALFLASWVVVLRPVGEEVLIHEQVFHNNSARYSTPDRRRGIWRSIFDWSPNRPATAAPSGSRLAAETGAGLRLGRW